MHLIGKALKKHLPEIEDLQRRTFHQIVTGVDYFAIVEKGQLQAYGLVKCDADQYYLRGCFVKPEFRGRGLQRKLIDERVEFIRARGANAARVAVRPENSYSLRNIIASGFEYERQVKFPDGRRYIYLKQL